MESHWSLNFIRQILETKTEARGHGSVLIGLISDSGENINFPISLTFPPKGKKLRIRSPCASLNEVVIVSASSKLQLAWQTLTSDYMFDIAIQERSGQAWWQYYCSPHQILNRDESVMWNLLKNKGQHSKSSVRIFTELFFMLIKTELDMIQFEINVVRHSKLIQTDSKKYRFRDGWQDISRALDSRWWCKSMMIFV